MVQIAELGLPLGTGGKGAPHGEQEDREASGEDRSGQVAGEA